MNEQNTVFVSASKFHIIRVINYKRLEQVYPLNRALALNGLVTRYALKRISRFLPPARTPKGYPRVRRRRGGESPRQTNVRVNREQMAIYAHHRCVAGLLSRYLMLINRADPLTSCGRFEPSTTPPRTRKRASAGFDAHVGRFH
ncbi:hypothetical protein EVAR_80118_1 [Eumeta japonica]|uniref:Uncharacterized protein n=1 Tax=Eumeta variegata TaxID=151549 RepID=A0A4C1UCT9_EUMVA|nr:hypothetical protein EVAR_80118_1 [Eumeta japonica]